MEQVTAAVEIDGHRPSDGAISPARRIGIAQLARRLGVSLRTLRYYEQVGLVRPDRRGAVRERMFEPQECEILEEIVVLRAAGLSVECIRRLQSLKGQPRRRRRELVAALDVVLAEKMRAVRTIERLRLEA